MPGEWYNQAEAKAILDNLDPSDIHIELERTEKGPVFVWGLREDLSNRLELIRYCTVDEQVGYKLDDATDYDAEDVWYSEEERQASISARILLKYGDPNVLFGYGLDSANKLWRKDVNSINRVLQHQKDIEEFQKNSV